MDLTEIIDNLFACLTGSYVTSLLITVIILECLIKSETKILKNMSEPTINALNKSYWLTYNENLYIIILVSGLIIGLNFGLLIFYNS